MCDAFYKYTSEKIKEMSKVSPQVNTLCPLVFKNDSSLFSIFGKKFQLIYCCKFLWLLIILFNSANETPQKIIAVHS